MPLISVIVPVYNVEKYLKQCINSIITQSITDLEIILINDGSIDKSGIICDNFAAKDNRIRVIHKENTGLSEARNAGLKIARGDYIAFLDSDDWIEKELYSYLYSLIVRENADIVQCDFIKAYNDTDKINNDNEIIESIYIGTEGLGLLNGPEKFKTVVVWNKLYRRELFNNISFPFGKIHEDEFTTYKLINQANKIINSSAIMIYYRQRNDSIMAEHFSEKKLDIIEAWKEKIDYFDNINFDFQVKSTNSDLCGILKWLYIEAYKSNIPNKKVILQYLKKEMKSNYISFILNPYIKIKHKITLTLCIFNGPLFYSFFKYTRK